MARATPPSFEQINEQLAYDPETGAITWRLSKKGNSGAGTSAGCNHPALGYVLIGVLRQRLYGHRIAWLLTHGHWPEHQIDHINGNRADNRLANLRECSHAENQQNGLARRNRHGYPGVDQDPKTGKYRSRVVIGGVKHNMGGFDSPEQAHNAYLEAKQRLHPFYARSL